VIPVDVGAALSRPVLLSFIRTTLRSFDYFDKSDTLVASSPAVA